MPILSKVDFTQVIFTFGTDFACVGAKGLIVCKYPPLFAPFGSQLGLFYVRTSLKIRFTLPVEPFSVNAMYSRDKRHKTKDYKDWEILALQSMAKPDAQAQLKQMRESFDANQHCLAVRFDYYFPASVLYNKQGQISSRAQDLSNIEKPLLDLLCLPKFHVQPLPWGVPNLNCDDKHVLTLISRKLPAEHYKIVITCRLVKLKVHP